MKKTLSLVLIITLTLYAKAYAFISDTDTSKIYTVVQKYPEFPGGESKFQEFIESHQKWPDYNHRYIGGNVALTFIVEKDGTLGHFKLIGYPNKFCGKEAIRLLKLSSKWHPGMINGRAVRVLHTYYVHLIDRTYEPGDPAGPAEMLTDSEINIKIFVAVEYMPEFPGGMEEFQKYIQNNIKYPSLALKNNVEGKVYIGFVVEKDGSLTDVKVLRGIGNDCDEEAIRLIKIAPNGTRESKMA